MLSIDETIAKYKEITSTDANCPSHCNISCDKCVQESRQLVEWLEELKDYRDKNKMVFLVDVENMDSIKDKIEELSRYAENQYNKAIDDFVDKLKQDVMTMTFGLRICDIYRVAEQLKAGGENDSI